MTAPEACELTTQGGATDFARLIRACESSGCYCLIGGLAVNCYVEPVYTLDADLVVISAALPGVAERLEAEGFKTEVHAHPLNALAPGSTLRIQFTTDERYQTFPARSIEAEVLGVRVKIACLADVTQGKLWAYTDPRRRLSKLKKDELDLIRLAEAYPQLKSLLPSRATGHDRPRLIMAVLKVKVEPAEARVAYSALFPPADNGRGWDPVTSKAKLFHSCFH
jgi:hypothetical protein